MIGVAYAAILIWPVVVIVLFRTLPFRDALIWAIVGGYLLLPNPVNVGIDLPVVPPMDKNMTPVLAATLMALYVLGKSRREQAAGRTDLPVPDVTVLSGWIPRAFLGWFPLALIFVGIVFTALTNGDALYYGPRRLPPQSLYDAFTNILSAALYFLPVLLGRKFLSDEEGQKRLLMIMVLSALAYSLPILWESRMSPRISLTIYGFFPHDSWAQHLRPGGWRPIVFLVHGLLVGIYVSLATLAAVALLRSESSGRRLFLILSAVWLTFVLSMSQNLGAFIILMIMAPVIFFMPVRLQLMVAAIIAVFIMAYPVLRGAYLVPTDAVVEQAARIHEERARSLEFRFDNEDVLLEHASQRPVFGWGWWTRNWVYDTNGEPVTIVDSSWIVIIGVSGWVGFIGTFGLLCFPLILFFFRRKRYEVGTITAGLCLVVAANLIDLIPNSSLTPVLWLSMGALLGQLERKPYPTTDHAAETVEAASAPPELEPNLEMTRYSRYPVRKGTRRGTS